MEYPEKFVDFDCYCKKCEYWEVSDDKDPCDECLENPVNWYSHKPVNFKEKEEN